MKKILLVLAIVLFAMSSCSSSDDGGSENVADNALKSVVLTEGETRVASTNKPFAFHLFKSANSTLPEAKTLAISPLSASIALAMLSNGAAGNTQEELLQALGLEGSDMATVNAYNKKLVNELEHLDNNSTIKIANSVWLNSGFQALDAFKDTIANSYNAKVEETDFATALPTIQKWCSDNTEGLIQDFPKELDENEKVALLNALYFNGNWTYPFDETKTKDYTFANEDGTTTTSSFLCDERYFLYGNKESFSWVNLPYGNGTFSLYIILPNENTSIEQCINTLCDSSWDDILEGAASQSVNLRLPKFSVNENYSLVEALKEMGINDAFTLSADFSNLSDEALTVSKVEQASSFSIDEKGVEAAAVTEIGMDSAAPTDTDMTVDFHAQRPFVFLLTEKSTGCVLFIGKIAQL